MHGPGGLPRPRREPHIARLLHDHAGVHPRSGRRVRLRLRHEHGARHAAGRAGEWDGGPDGGSEPDPTITTGHRRNMATSAPGGGVGPRCQRPARAEPMLVADGVACPSCVVNIESHAEPSRRRRQRRCQLRRRTDHRLLRPRTAHHDDLPRDEHAPATGYGRTASGIGGHRGRRSDGAQPRSAT